MEPDIAVGFCSAEGDICGQFVRSLTALYTRYPELPSRTVHIIAGPDVADSRNIIVRTFLAKTDAARLLMVDTDIVFTVEDVETLMGYDEAVVSGVYADAHGKLVTKGAGFQLIRRDLLESIGGGWFDHLPGLSEDLSFRQRVGSENVRVVSPVRVGHVKPRVLYP